MTGHSKFALVLLLLPAVALSLAMLPAGSARLALELNTTGKVDGDNDARLELVLRNAGNADMEVLHLAKAELVWESGRAALEPLRLVGGLRRGKAEACPLETIDPIWFEGDSADARLDLDFTWRSRGVWERTSWVLPVVLRR